MSVRLRDTVSSYSRDWVGVQRRYQEHSSSLVSPRQMVDRTASLCGPLPKQEFEIDAFAPDTIDDSGSEEGSEKVSGWCYGVSFVVLRVNSNQTYFFNRVLLRGTPSIKARLLEEVGHLASLIFAIQKVILSSLQFWNVFLLRLWMSPTVDRGLKSGKIVSSFFIPHPFPASLKQVEVTGLNVEFLLTSQQSTWANEFLSSAWNSSMLFAEDFYFFWPA